MSDQFKLVLVPERLSCQYNLIFDIQQLITLNVKSSCMGCVQILIKVCDDGQGRIFNFKKLNDEYLYLI